MLNFNLTVHPIVLVVTKHDVIFVRNRIHRRTTILTKIYNWRISIDETFSTKYGKLLSGTWIRDFIDIDENSKRMKIDKQNHYQLYITMEKVS